MELILSEDQELIAKTAQDFAKDHSPVSRFRALRDSGDETGFSKALWKEMADLGWIGIPFPEAYGGADMGFADLAVVVEALGKNLAPEPFLGTVGIAGQALLLGGGDALKEAWLPGVVAGEKFLALAQQEAGSRFALSHVTTRAEKSGTGYRISGEKIQVLDAPAADAFVVVARTSGGDRDDSGISLFLVPADAAGVTVERQSRVDSRPAGIVRFDGVAVDGEARLGEEGVGIALLEDVFDRGLVVLTSEMLGGMQQAFDLTIEYLKEREQFGVRIGTFQALKHRAAEMYIQLELARSSVMAAARALDAGDENARKLVSLAKAQCSDAYVHIANEGVQIFAGVGMTDEYDIGFYMKRARACELSLGDSAWHRERWARLSSY